MITAGILPVFSGVAVHDALTGYFDDTVTLQVVAHQLCWAHLDRALEALTCSTGPPRPADGPRTRET